MLAKDVAVLQVLDKVSARTTRLRVPVNSVAAFGLIVMTVRSCQVAPPSEPPESSAFLEISEIDINRPVRGTGSGAAVPVQAERLLFSGWMFASSPALSALEHPTYDVTVIGCESRTATPAERAAAGEEGLSTVPAALPAESVAGSADSGQDTAAPAPPD